MNILTVTESRNKVTGC